MLQGMRRKFNLIAGALAASLTMALLTACTSASASAQPAPDTATSVPSTSASVPASVPAQFRGDYATLEANISDLQRQQDQGATDPVHPASGTITAGALNVADGNRGRSLLAPGTLAEVGAVLDRFQDLGIKGVMLEVGYPMLLPSFPDSSAYLAFYKSVASMVSAHSMVLSIELNPIFTNPQISSLDPDYSGLTVSSYADTQRQEAQLVIDQLHPRYLTLLDEPSTFASNLGLPIANSAAVVSLLNQELSGLDRGTTLVGAGIGTWESAAIEEAIATRTSVDYLSVHVYPTGPEQLSTLDQVTSIAARAEKPLVMDETWLSKSDPTGRPGKGNAVVEQTEKEWSFWEPLDATYLTTITAYAKSHGISLISPFSTDLFFGYVPWTTALASGPGKNVRVTASRIELSNIESGQPDPVGLAYAQAASKS